MTSINQRNRKSLGNKSNFLLDDTKIIIIFFFLSQRGGYTA